MSNEGIGTKILNSHIGTNNIISRKDLSITMMKTFEGLGDILSDHCGPYGKYAIINDLLHPTAEPIFTKDGINIVRSIQYVSAMEEFCRKMVAYIGSRIESEAGDGTTTAMLLTVKAMAYLFKELESIKYNHRSLLQQYESFLSEYKTISEIHKFNKCDVKDLMCISNPNVTDEEVISAIAYHQAYTSSHGDIELANAVSEMFLNTPESAWDYICFEREGYETKKRISFNIDFNQFSTKVNVFKKSMLNTDLGTKHIANGELVTIVEDLTLTSLVFSMLIAKIKIAIENNETLIVVCSSNMCQQTRDTLDDTLQSDIPHKVIIFEHRLEDPNLNDLIALNLICNIPMAVPIEHDQLVTTQNVYCIYENGILKLNNLYENPNDSYVHPSVEDKENTSMKYMLNHIKAIIDNLKNGTPSRTSRYDIVRFQKLYNKIFLTRRGVIRVGGSAHDNTATIDVIADVVNAVRSSLEYGFVLANGVTMHYVLTGINNVKNDLFKQAFLYGLNAVRDAVYSNSPYEKFEPSYNTSVDILTSSSCVITRSESWNTSTPLIIQPANIDIQILERFGEVALKFLCSNKVVSPGGVYLHEEDLT